MAQDSKLWVSCLSGYQFDVCTKSKVHLLCCCYNPCAASSGFCQVESAKTTAYSIANKEVIAPQQCHGFKENENEAMNCGFCNSAPLHFCSCFGTNSSIIPKERARKDIGITVLSDNHLNIVASIGIAPFLESIPTANNGEPTKAPASGNITSRDAVDKKPNTNLYIEIGASIIGSIIVLIALYIFFCSGKKKQKKNEDNDEVSAMEMGNLRTREDRNEDTGVPTTRISNLSIPDSTASSAFTNPRRAPFPPPSSPPPDRPLPPLPRREPATPPLGFCRA
ncbi:hypothetical protein E0Z10_g10573 [Xylaria hypoxylon]|uniref:Uncharacterized protein n=1 Tax=Xylaria hypoxylon TaxID=37992 RepID=A0A4Z0YG19_9PEZI|nr:hypothetical protein E0Z10_g10573 [Xylaria hypoxylon]